MVWHRLARMILAASVIGLCLAPAAAEARNDHRHGKGRHYQHAPRYQHGHHYGRHHAPKWHGHKGGHRYGGQRWNWGRSAGYWGPRSYGRRGCD